MFLFKSALGECEEECETSKCSDVAVDSRPRSSAADRALFGGERSPRVRAASCGALGTVCTQRAFNDICSFLTALRTQRRSASSLWPFLQPSDSTRRSCTGMLSEKRPLKRLPLFLGRAFVLSLEPLLARPSLRAHTAACRHAAQCVNGVASKRSEGRETSAGGGCDRQQEVGRLPRKRDNATTCSAVNQMQAAKASLIAARETCWWLSRAQEAAVRRRQLPPLGTAAGHGCWGVASC